jgi:hypothetical protein
VVIQKIEIITIPVCQFAIHLVLMASVLLLTNVHVIMDFPKMQKMQQTVYQPVTHPVIMESARDQIHVHAMKDSARTAKITENVYQFAQQDVLMGHA